MPFSTQSSAPSAVFDYGFGASWDAGGSRFRVWAPAHTDLRLELDDGRSIAMAPAKEGWFEARVIAPSGARYRYRFEDGDVAPDPASRALSGDVHGWSVLVDPTAYHWRESQWRGRPWQESVIYEMHVGLAGGFSAARDKLAALAQLGITALQLMPIADFSGTRSWGYDGVQHFAPAEAYGSPEELKALVDHAHALRMSVFLDVVYNHFGPDGAWIGKFAPQLFRSDLATPWGDAIDFRRPEVQAYFVGNALYWLNEYRLDGLRFDAVHAIQPDEAMAGMARAIRAALPTGRHVHLIVENEHNDAELLDGGAVTAQWNDDFHNAMHVVLTGETHGYYRDFADRPIERLCRALNEGFAYQGDWSASLDRPRGQPSAHLPPVRFVNFLQNHDQVGNRARGERLTELVDPGALRAAMVLLLLSPQIPMLFMGEESGSRTPFFYFTDYAGDLAEAVRAGRQREFSRDPSFAGAVLDPSCPKTFELSAPMPGEDFADWERVIREGLSERGSLLALGLATPGSAEARPLAARALSANWTLNGGAMLHILCNFGEAELPIGRPKGRMLVASDRGIAAELSAGRLPARAGAAFISPG